MPRVNNVYELPPGTYGVSGTPILSNRYNTFVDDVAADLNAPRPITAGGTGATSAIGAHDGVTTKGADIAAAATLNLDNATGYFVDVTGNTGITAVTLTAGRQRMVRFTGAPLITVGANLVGNNGGQNIQVEAGDMATFEGFSSNVVRFWLTRANGGPVQQAGAIQTIISTDAGATVGPVLDLYRNSASPAVSDLLGSVRFRGKDSGGNIETYANIGAVIVDPANASEGSRLDISYRNAGATKTIQIGQDNTIIFPDLFSLGWLAGSTDPSIQASLSPTTLITYRAATHNLIGNVFTGALTVQTGDLHAYSGAPISGLTGGSTNGFIIEGANLGHLVLGIRDNDSGDSVSIVSYDGTGAYSRLVAAFRANGAVNMDNLNTGTFSATGATNGKQTDTVTACSLDSSRSVTTVALHQRFYNPNGQVGSITTTGSATAFNTSSDERLKDFISVYDPLEALAVIRADPTRKFTWKADGTTAVGWGAQTSYAVSPDLASPGSGNPGDEDFIPWGVDQSKRTPYLWAVVPWLAERLDDVEARLSAAGL